MRGDPMKREKLQMWDKKNQLGVRSGAQIPVLTGGRLGGKGVVFARELKVGSMPTIDVLRLAGFLCGGSIGPSHIAIVPPVKAD